MGNKASVPRVDSMSEEEKDKLIRMTPECRYFPTPPSYDEAMAFDTPIILITDPNTTLIPSIPPKIKLSKSSSINKKGISLKLFIHHHKSKREHQMIDLPTTTGSTMVETETEDERDEYEYQVVF